LQQIYHIPRSNGADTLIVAFRDVKPSTLVGKCPPNKLHGNTEYLNVNATTVFYKGPTGAKLYPQNSL
jgi:hypothetical protein